MNDIVVAQPWDDGVSPLRNTEQEYLRFINTAVFSEEAHKFLKQGSDGVGSNIY